MLKLEYPSQREAYPFFLTAVTLFCLQVLYGLTLAVQHIDPLFLRNVANFNVNRAVHLNLAIVWIITGFIGMLFYLAPLLSARDLWHPVIARVLLVAIWLAGVWTVISLYFAQFGIAGWFLGQPWFQQGLEYISAGRITGVALLVVFIGVAWMVLRIFPAVREWNEIHYGLAIGVVGLGFFWLFGLFFVSHLDLQEYFRWFVVHYWVEGVWEILYASTVGAVLSTTTVPLPLFPTTPAPPIVK